MEGKRRGGRPKGAKDRRPRKRKPLPPKPPGKPGRKLTKIDPEQLRGLAAIFCTKAEAAGVLGISVDTLERRFATVPELKTVWEEGRQTGRASLRRNQFKLSERSAAMGIWLGKQELDQRDQIDFGLGRLRSADARTASDEKLDQFINALDALFEPPVS
jgi:hypothetical protein